MSVQTADERPTPLAATRRHPWLCAALVLLGVGAAVGYAYTQPVVYKAETRLAVAGSDLSAQLVPAFAFASEELAANYARYLNTEGTEDALAETIGAPPGGLVDIMASPIPESNVLRIEAEATTPEVAVEAAERLAEQLIEQVNQSRLQDAEAEEALQQYTDISAQVAAVEQEVLDITTRIDLVVGGAAGDVGQLRAVLADAQTRLDVLSVQQQALAERYQQLVAANSGTAADLDVVRPAEEVGDDRLARLQRLGLLGAAAGGALGVALSTFLERRRRRPSAPAPAAPTAGPASARATAAEANPAAHDDAHPAARSPASTRR